MKNVKYTDLDNGIVVITEELKDYLSVSAGVWLEFGSGDEEVRDNGVAHFFEHMVFKGTESYSALDLVQKIERKGGYINAYTTRENTCFYTKTMASEWKEALHILCSMVNEPLLEKEEFEREKEVILEEIQSAEDIPDDYSYDLLMEALYGKKGIGLPIAGTLSSVENLEWNALLNHHENLLSNCRIVVAAAGSICHDDIVTEVQKKLSRKKSTLVKENSVFTHGSGRLFKEKDVGQCTVHLGCDLGNLSIEERLHLHLIHQMWGEGMSSRLFQNIREKHGLVYSIYSGMDLFRSAGTFTVSLAAEENRLEKSLELLHEEVALLKKDSWRVEELSDAIQATVGGMALHRESSSNRMNALARRVFSDLRDMEFEERLSKIKSVTMADVEAMTERLWVPEWTLGGVVPNESKILKKANLNF